jgi:hypothetical protein
MNVIEGNVCSRFDYSIKWKGESILAEGERVVNVECK